MNCLALVADLRREPHNRRLLRLVAETLPTEVTLTTWNGLGSLPPFRPNGGEPPDLSVELRSAIASADALLFVMPEAGAPAREVLATAIAWAGALGERSPLRGRRAVVMGASSGLFSPLDARAACRRLLEAAGAEVVGADFQVSMAHLAFGEDGFLLDDDQQRMLNRVVGDLVSQGSLR